MRNKLGLHLKGILRPCILVLIFTLPMIVACSRELKSPSLVVQPDTPTVPQVLNFTSTLTATVQPTTTPEPTHTPQSSPTLKSTSLGVGPFQQVLTDEDLPGDLVSILNVSEEGVVWLASDTEVLKLQENSWQVYLPNIPGQLVGVDQSERVWVVAEDGGSISSWDGSTWNTYSSADGWIPLQGYSQVAGRPVSDQVGGLWLVTTADLRRFDSKGWQIIQPADLGIIHPLEDEEDILPYLTLKYLPGINELWMATCYWTGAGPIGGQGVWRYDGQDWFPVSESTSNGCTDVIVEDAQSSVWFGLGSEVWTYNRYSDSFSQIEAPTPLFEGGSFHGVEEITLDSNGNPWAEILLCGGAGCGFGPVLYRFDGSAWHLVLAEELQYVRKVVFDPSGNAWLLAPPGIFRIEDDQLIQESDIYIDPATISTDSIGRVWFLVNADNIKQLWMMNAKLSEP